MLSFSSFRSLTLLYEYACYGCVHEYQAVKYYLDFFLNQLAQSLPPACLVYRKGWMVVLSVLVALSRLVAWSRQCIYIYISIP